MAFKMKMRKKLEFEEKPLFNVVTVYRERGNYLQRLELFEKAIQSYNEALRWNNNDVPSLLGRSQARSKVTQYKGALEDVARATELEPENMTALQIRAKTEYEKCAFERSLVLAHRGLKIRKVPPDFADCAGIAEETVRECVGKSALKMLAKVDASLMLRLEDRLKAELVDEDAPVVLKRVSRMQPQPTRQSQEMSRVELQKSQQISRLMSSKYLERMAHDKYFLDKLCRDDRLMSANVKDSLKLKQLATKALADVKTRQDVLRERRPLYAARAAEEAARKRLLSRRKEQLIRAQAQHITDANRLLQTTQNMYEQRDTSKCLENAEFAMEQIARKPARLLPGKEKFIQQLQDLVASAFLDQKRVSLNMSESDREKRAFVLLGIALSREPSRDSVLRVRPPAPPRDAKRRLRTLERSLNLSTRASERCYILHEIARLHVDTKQSLKARFFAMKCQAEARAANLRVWLLNSTFLLARCHIQQNNRPEARASLIEGAALARSYRLGNVADFFDTCVNVSTEGEIEAAEAELEEREKAMVSLMQDDDLKAAAEYLFRRMSVMPTNRRRLNTSDTSITSVSEANRALQFATCNDTTCSIYKRFSIMPGAKMEDSTPNVNRRISINPAMQKPTQIASKKTKVLGLSDFDY